MEGSSSDQPPRLSPVSDRGVKLQDPVMILVEAVPEATLDRVDDIVEVDPRQAEDCFRQTLHVGPTAEQQGLSAGYEAPVVTTNHQQARVARLGHEGGTAVSLSAVVQLWEVSKPDLGTVLRHWVEEDALSTSHNNIAPKL